MRYETLPRSALGFTFRIETDDRSAFLDCEDAFQALPAADPGTAPTTLRLDYAGGCIEVPEGRFDLRPQEERSAVTEVARLLNARAASATIGHALVHGAAAARGDQAVVLCAEADAGKSTLVAALTQAGWHYLTDEIVAIGHADRKITPFRRPIKLEPGSWPHFEETTASPGDAGARHVAPDRLTPASAKRENPNAADTHPALIIIPRYDPSADRLRPIGITPAEALVHMLAQSFVHHLDPLDPDHLATLAHTVAGAPAYRLTYRFLDDAVTALDDAIAGIAGRVGNTMEIEASLTPRPRLGLTSVDFAQHSVLVDMATRQAVALDAIATGMWRSGADAHSTDDLDPALARLLIQSGLVSATPAP